MLVIKSRTTADFITPDGNLGNLNEAARFQSKEVAEQAMKYWELGGECRVRRVLPSKQKVEVMSNLIRDGPKQVLSGSG